MSASSNWHYRSAVAGT